MYHILPRKSQTTQQALNFTIGDVFVPRLSGTKYVNFQEKKVTQSILTVSCKLTEITF